MNNSTPKDNQSPRLYVKRWMRMFMYGVCLLPILLMPWVLLSQLGRQNGSGLVAIAICVGVIVPFAWFFARLYSLCSIELNHEGVKQSFALFHIGVGKHVRLRWDQVQYVTFSRHSYHFIGQDGSKMELNTALFGDAETAIQTVRTLLPQRLLSQLDQVAVVRESSRPSNE